MTGNETGRGASARFVDMYKWVYLLAILANLFLMSRDQIDILEPGPYVVIDTAVFLVNLVA